jgi:predicted MPP superfamily phosphohydrolase
MFVFLIIFLTTYGLMNAYVFFWVQRALSLQGPKLWGFLAFLLLMVTGFILVRILEPGPAAPLAKILAYVTYSWMAVVLWIIAIGLFVDLWNLGVWTASKFRTESIYLFVPYRQGFMAIVGLVAFASLWGVVEAGWQTSETVEIQTASLPPGSPPITIAQVSDIHFGLIEGTGRWNKIKMILDEEKPDILVGTGDLVDGMAPHLNHISGLIAARDFPLGKYSVTGNHEFYAGLKGSTDFHQSSGFNLLRQEAVEVGEHLLIVGVDDPAGDYRGNGAMLDESAVLPEETDRFVLLLKHQPDVTPASLGMFDLQLSGHTHKGQIYPFYHLVKLRHPFIDGLYDAGKGSQVYVNRGTGTWGPPLRFFATPEVTFIRLVPAEG